MKVEVVKDELFDLLSRELSVDLTYHSLRHTQDVLRVCIEHAENSNLTKREEKLLQIAAVGHDVGFTRTYLNHEEVSAEVTASIMKKHGHESEDIALVSQMIMATRIPQNPNGKLAEILCDADLDYLGRSEDFEYIGNLLKKEWIAYSVIPNVEENFDTIQMNFLENHTYHTEYAKKNREPQKQKHLNEIIKRLEKDSLLT